MSLPEDIFDAVGRLALLSFRVDACRDKIQREGWLREMHVVSTELNVKLMLLCDCGDELAGAQRESLSPAPDTTPAPLQPD